ncbi:MAG: hypothetical protein Fur0043_05150 [Anaerolineales bacterium]
MKAAGRALFLLAFAVPALVGIVIYAQVRSPVFDAALDLASGEILEVEQDSFANWAGFWPGDVILSVDGKPYPQWPQAVGNYPAQVRRGAQVIQMEIPLVSMARLNLPALLGGMAAALLFWASGLLLLVRRFGQAEVRWLFLLSQTLSITILFPAAYAPNWPPPAWGTDLSVACLFFSAPLILHHYLTFPVSLGAPGLRRWGMSALYVLALGVFVLWLAMPPLGRRLGMAFAACVVAAALLALGYSYVRRASPDERRRLRLIFFGALLGGLPALLFYFLPSIFNLRPFLPLWAAALFTTAAPLSYLYAILRHNLFGIDRLLNRALVYAALSLGILILYLGPFLLIYRLAPGDWLAQAMTASGLTLAVGLAFEPTRAALQRFVDRLFYGGWYDYPGVVEQVTRALSACTDRAQLTDVLARQAPALMQLQGCELAFTEPAEGRRSRAGEKAESPISISTFLRPRPQPQEKPFHAIRLSFQEQPRAVWKVGPHRDGDELSDSDRRILGTLARQAEIALENILLIETLRAQLEEIRSSREALSQAQRRLLHSREEERARLSRDLHDGPLQSLIGLNLQLGLLAAQSGDLAALNDMRAEVRRLLNDLRGVCAELRPPMLDTLGLAAALRSLAEEWSAQNGVEVSLDLPPEAALPPLPGDAAVNLYRVAQEALNNIARHAQARHVNLSLAATGKGLRLTIEDDGRGFTPPAEIHELAAHGHFGLVGLQERVSLIGGVLTLHSAPSQGTRLSVEL